MNDPIPLYVGKVDLAEILQKGRDLTLTEEDVSKFLSRYKNVYDMEYRRRYIKEVSWAFFTVEYADSLARLLAGKRVLEVCAGNGHLARLMQARGIDWFPIDLNLSACPLGKGVVKWGIALHEAVQRKGQYDILYGSWLPIKSTLDVDLLSCGVPLVLLGTVGEGGCAGTDEFWSREGTSFSCVRLAQRLPWFRDSPQWHRIDTHTSLILPAGTGVVLDGRLFLAGAG